MWSMQITHALPRQHPLTIEQAQAEHMAAVTGIYAHYVLNAVCTMEEIPPSVAEMHERHAELRREGLPWLVALSGAEVLGYAYAGRYRPRAGYHGTAETSIYVHPAQHGCGVGQALLASLIEECASLKLRQLVAVIVDGADTAGSVRLHQRFGFRQVGVFAQVGRKFGRDIDTLLLQRSVAAA